MPIKATKNAWHNWTMPRNYQTKCQFSTSPGYICGEPATFIAEGDFAGMGVCDEHAERYRHNPEWSVRLRRK